MAKLTIKSIKLLSYDSEKGGRQIYWDDSLVGFGVRVYPSGKKSFVLRYQFKGRKFIKTLGGFGALTFDEAKGIAKNALFALYSGKDPFNKAKAIKVSAFCELFLEQHSKLRKKTWKYDQDRMNRVIIPQFGKKRLNEIEPLDIVTWFSSYSKTSPVEANRILELIKTMFNKAIEWNYLGKNPAKHISKNREKSKDRFLTEKELPIFAEAINKHPNPYFRCAIWLYILTGARFNELIRLSWKQVDFSARTLTFLETKNGKNHIVPISSLAEKYLKELQAWKIGPYVFPDIRNPQTHRKSFYRAFNKLKTECGIKDITLHDLRRTCGSWLAQNGASLHLIGEVLNHKDIKATQIYARFHDSDKREALEQLGTKIASLSKFAVH